MDARRLVSYLVGCLPARVKAVYILNEAWYMSTLWAVAKPFLKEKIADRTHVLGKSVGLLRVRVQAPPSD